METRTSHDIISKLNHFSTRHRAIFETSDSFETENKCKMFDLHHQKNTWASNEKFTNEKFLLNAQKNKILQIDSLWCVREIVDLLSFVVSNFRQLHWILQVWFLHFTWRHWNLSLFSSRFSIDEKSHETDLARSKSEVKLNRCWFARFQCGGKSFGENRVCFKFRVVSEREKSRKLLARIGGEKQRCDDYIRRNRRHKHDFVISIKLLALCNFSSSIGNRFIKWLQDFQHVVPQNVNRFLQVFNCIGATQVIDSSL